MVELDCVVTPNLIVPEWYFLWMFGCLRGVDGTLVGVLCVLWCLLCGGVFV